MHDNNKRTIRIAVADNSDLVIHGIQTAIESDVRMQVSHKARSLEALIEAAVKAPPDVILLDENLYNAPVLPSVQQLQQLMPGARIIVMGTQNNGLLIQDLFSAGMCGYLYRADDLLTHLTTAIELVMRNRPYLSPTANSEYIVAMQAAHFPNRLDEESQMVLQLLARGEPVGQIATLMQISRRRVYWLRQKLRDRFAANTNEHMIRCAVQEGYICLSE